MLATAARTRVPPTSTPTTKPTCRSTEYRVATRPGMPRRFPSWWTRPIRSSRATAWDTVGLESPVRFAICGRAMGPWRKTASRTACSESSRSSPWWMTPGPGEARTGPSSDGPDEVAPRGAPPRCASIRGVLSSGRRASKDPFLTYSTRGGWHNGASRRGCSMTGEGSLVSSRLTRREFLKVGGATAGLAVLAACGGGGGGTASSGGGGGGSGTINALFMQQAAYSVDDIKGMTKAFQQANPKIKVNTTFVAYEALHDKIVAAAPAGTYDVVLMDVIWPAEFGSKHEVMDVTDRYPASWKTEIFPGALETAEYNGRFYGVPWILDTKYVFYNKDMLQKAGVQPPTTWDEVV